MNKYILNDKYPIISGTLQLVSEGIWVGSLVVDTIDELDTSDLGITMTWIDTTEFVGTIIDSTIVGGQTRLTIVGGTGRLSQVIEQKQYQSVTLETVLKDIATVTGHTLSSTIDKAFINVVLPNWVRITGQASQSIEAALAPFNGIWQILPDGTLWVGTDNYPELLTTITVLDRNPDEGYWTIYNDETLIRPPFTLEENKINQVTYELTEDGVAIYIIFNNIKDNIYAISSQQVQNAYNGIYRCRIVAQNTDGTLELQMDPAIELFKNGLSKVPYCPPMPNTKITVGYGTYAVLAFLNGDPRYPRIIAWDSFTQPSKVEISAKDSAAAARKGDSCGFLTFNPGMSGATLTYNSDAGNIGPIKIQQGSPDVFIG